MKGLVVFALTPLWLPVLFAAASASLAIGLTMTVMSIALKHRNEPDPWET